jgi:hypothetical protein
MKKTKEVKEEQVVEHVQAKEKQPEQKPLVKLFKRVAFDWFLLIGLYLPYMIFTIARFVPDDQLYNRVWDQDAIDEYQGTTYKPRPGMNSVVGRSLSSLAWILNIGWGALVFYLVFAIGFMVYQVYVFNKLSGNKRKKFSLWIMITMIFGGVVLAAGSFMPISHNPMNPLDILHSTLCPIGAGTMVIAVGLMVIYFCIDSKGNWRTKSIAITAFSLLAILSCVGIVLLPFFSALFSLVCTFMAMVYMHYLTVTYELSKMQAA